MKVLCNCKLCDIEFLTYMSEIIKGGGVHCSISCYNLSKKGKNNPNWKGGISKKILNCELCGKQTSDYRYKRCGKCANVGRKLTDIHKNKIVKYLNRASGKKCNFWRGGISKLQRLIRCSVENNKWRNKVFERDDWTCKECFKRGSYLEAHHIELFVIIFDKFLKEYNQFSPVEDKNTLARIAQGYNKFWDINNGVTLCRSCHEKTKNNIRGEKK